MDDDVVLASDEFYADVVGELEREAGE
jgi:hypothetical protein